MESLAVSSLSSCWLWYKVTDTDMDAESQTHTVHTTPPYNTHTGHSFLATRFRSRKTLLVEAFMAEELKALRVSRVRRKVRKELEKTLITGLQSGKNTTQVHPE